MVEKKAADKHMINLYDAEGAHVGQAEFDEYPSDAYVINVGQQAYVWNQRNSQFRAANPMEGKAVKTADEPVTGWSPKAVEYTLANPAGESVDPATAKD